MQMIYFVLVASVLAAIARDHETIHNLTLARATNDSFYCTTMPGGRDLYCPCDVPCCSSGFPRDPFYGCGPIRHQGGSCLKPAYRCWNLARSKNCYEMHGGIPLLADRAIPGKSLQGCKDTCSSWYDWYGKQCTAVTQNAAGDCWLRLSVTTYACESDSNYDTYVVDAASGTWTKYAATDCYEGAGGVPMPDVPWGGNLKLGEWGKE